jgi:hypothetical protein
MSEDARYAERFLCALFGTVAKPIADLRLLTLVYALCSLRLAFRLKRNSPKRLPHWLSIKSPRDRSPRGGIPERSARAELR